MKNKSIMLGLLGEKGFEETRRIWSTGGVSPCIKVGGDPIKILEIKEVKNERKIFQSGLYDIS